ncbi:MAG TPA: hypothetical protein VJ984_06175 [Xanthomonadales bacterium]|nr:hypothetical protein [Xanthomonadales bacterium]
MKRLITALLLSCLVASTQAETRDTPIQSFEPFIGEWRVQPNDPMMEKIPEEMQGLASFTFGWGPAERSIKMWEMHPPEEATAAVMEGMGAWNPVTNSIVFLGFNKDSDYLFSGEFRFEGEQSLVREYQVYYPGDDEWSSQVGVKSMRFRDILTLTGKNKMQQQVEYYSVSARQWLSFIPVERIGLIRVGK